MPEIREGPTPFWGGRGEGAASGGRQAASKGRRAGGGGSKRERERETQIGQGVPQGGGRP